MNRSRMLQSLISVSVGADPAFIFSVQTDLAGTSANNQFTMPVRSGTYDYTIEWGDGTSDSNVTSSITHTYATAGTYDIRITGTYPELSFRTAGDNSKLLEVKNWGTTIGTYFRSFSFCGNLTTVSATDVPNLLGSNNLSFFFESSGITNVNRIGDWDVSHITNMSAAFRNTSFNQDISGWDVGLVENFGGLFQGTPFNQNIGNWNTSSATDMTAMFRVNSVFNQDISSWNIGIVTTFNLFLDTGGSLSTANYDALLVGWESQSVQNNVTADFGNSTYTLGSPAADARQRLITDHSWSITDGGGI